MGNYAGLTIGAAEGRDGAGYTVSDAGDFNGDGIADMLVTAKYRYSNTEGSAYVVFGTLDGPATFSLADIDGTNGVELTANDANNLPDNNYTSSVYGLGVFAAGVGDINGDGIDDIVVGGNTARFYYEGQYARPNGLFVVFGRNTALDGDEASDTVLDANFGATLDVGTLDGTNGFQVDGVTGVVTGVSSGDINGDGLGDLLISQTPIAESSYDGYYGGEVFAVANAVAAPPVDAGGGPVAAALSPDGTYGGYVILGDTGIGGGGIFDVNDLDGANGFGLLTERSLVNGGFYGEGSYYGAPIELGQATILGDVNGDGFADIGIQRSVADAFYVDPDNDPATADGYYGTSISNRAFVVFGRDTDVSPFEAGLDPAVSADPGVAEVFWSALTSDSFENGRFGFYSDNNVLAGIGDINGDGFDDVAVGNPNINSYGSDNPAVEDSTGRVSVYFGGPVGVDGDLNRDTDGNGESDGLNVNGTQAIGQANSADLIILKSDGVYDGFGGNIAGLGDINGDGVDDFAITAARGNRFFGPQELSLDGPGGSVTGQASVFLMLGQTGFDGTTSTVIDLDNLDPTEVDQTAYRFFSTSIGGFEGQTSNFGQSVSAVGDVNGDGFNDFIIGSSGATSANAYLGGEAYVVFGGTAALEAADNADGFDDNVINVDSLGVDIDTGILPIEVSVESAGFFSEFRSEGDVGATIFTFTVERTGDLSEIVSFDFDVTGTGSRPADGTDFVGGVLPTGNVSFASGEATTTVEIQVQGDFDIENSEDFSLVISNPTTDGPSPVSIIGDTTFGRISNDDFPVQFRVNNTSEDEGNPGDNNQLVFTVTRSGETEVAASVDFSVDLGSAEADDLVPGELRTGTLDFAAGETSQTVTVDIAGDSVEESNETVFVRLSNDVAPIDSEIRDGFGFGTILNDDFAPRIQVTVNGSTFGTSLLEGDSGLTPVEFLIERLGGTNGVSGSSGVTTVTYDLNPLPSPGNFFAADGNDIDSFLPSFGNTVTFLDGESAKSVIVNVIGDGIIEPREQFELRITEVETFNGVDYDIFNADARVTILNDDGRPPIIPDGVEADVFGDPHIVTLDGLGYDFQAVGEYILVETLDGATNPFQVQVRFEPLDGSDLVSTTTRMAVVVNGVTIEIDAKSDNPLIIGGAVPTADQLSLGSIDVNPTIGVDGELIPTAPDVFFDAALSEFTIVLNDQGEQLKIKNMDGALNVCVFLADTPTGNQGNVRGLMGDADGDGDTSDDIALRDGTVLEQPLDFDTLYGDFAISWNVDGSDAKPSLFTDGSVARDPGFPIALLSVDDLPADLRAQAEAAVLAAQEAAGEPLDPAIFEAAVLDFALTGNPDFISGALGLAAEQTDTTEPDPVTAPVLPATVTISTAPVELVEDDSGSTLVTVTISRFGDTSGDLTVDYAIGGDVDADDLLAGTPLTGSVVFNDGDTVQNVTLSVAGDLTTEDDEALTVTITDAGGALVAGASATTTIFTDDFAPVAADDAFSTDEDTAVSSNVLLGDVLQDAVDDAAGEDTDADGDTLTVVSVTDSSGATRLANGNLFILDSGARLFMNSDGSFEYQPFGNTLGPSATRDTVFDRLDAGEVGTETFTYVVSDGNGGSDTATVTINVQGINDAPVARIDQFALTEDEATSGNVLDGASTIIGPDFDPEGDPLVVTRINGQLLTNIDEDATAAGTQITTTRGGQLTIFANGDVSFDTAGGYENLGDQPGQLVSLLESFTYTIADANGLEDSDLLRFSIAGVNDAPDVVALDVERTEGNASDAIDLLAGATDREGDALSIENLAIAAEGAPRLIGIQSDPVTGELILNAGQFEDLAAGEVLTLTATFDVSDGQAVTPNSLTITITGENDGPLAPGFTEVVDADALDTPFDLLTGASDPEGDDLDVANVTATDDLGNDVNVTVNEEDGTLLLDGAQFVPLGADETRFVNLVYTVTDGAAEVVTSATIEVLGVNDAPDITSGAALSIEENTTAVGTVTAEDPDLSDTLVFEISGGADGDLFRIDETTGALSFADAPDFEAPGDAGGTPGDNVYEVEVTVADGPEVDRGRGTDSQTILVTVTDDPADNAPEPVVIEGTEGRDRLVGTDADEIFRSLGGSPDMMMGGGGADVFEFGDETSNGRREFTYITDFGDDDFLDLGGSSILREINLPSRTYLLLEGDLDIVVLTGVSDFDDTQLL